MSAGARVAVGWVEQGLVPDKVVRLGIRRLLKERLDEIADRDAEAAAEMTTAFVRSLGQAPVALLTEKANEQHYEVPAAFFQAVLGPRLKYSCALWPEGVNTLAEAEAAALATTCERAGLANGQNVLELGCGWGSLSLWMAQRYPDSLFTGVSNSHSQREYIEAQARERGLRNLRIITADVNHFETGDRYDRVVSVEMFEHLRNWPEAFRRVAGWLKPDGRFFMHVFAHRSTPYEFVVRDETDWMSQHFFSGGMMPSDDLVLHCQDDLKLQQRWRWNGRHYARTSEAWLANMDAARPQLWPLFERTYGAEAAVWWTRWRLFFLSVAELFGYDEGQQWWVSHYLLAPRAANR
ncbi:cyclopropane-fatty-acyl-phospholipid synthase family protein [Aquincola tertiaricarbonis]|uniref:Cyclopropane-fatty-acyl-phospholipid synthase family protein n=1 Tax=Aquincola tertiaricarbonis TaxID=391953 RepID=A0ABY4SC11_AQUTE|nr:cyclopropane-fatty-acyl-phospholipid synthase family protein [Aquincola tertiaricarbonis]URI08586.1 cyclopropane-fatty-acyl-phospholipid synthase family protein [Aquincola tertiaricarbonis]